MSGVDIETEWNLKEDGWDGCRSTDLGRYRNRVEFKGFIDNIEINYCPVDIETEWNLKLFETHIRRTPKMGRYRNRVEFKVLLYFIFHHHISGRYRNRVEFKVISRICLSITLSS